MITAAIAFFRGFLAGFRQFGHTLTTIINSVLLSVVYVFGIGLSALSMKLMRKKFMDMTINKNTKTYWVKKEHEEGKEQYYRMF